MDLRSKWPAAPYEQLRPLNPAAPYEHLHPRNPAENSLLSKSFHPELYNAAQHHVQQHLPFPGNAYCHPQHLAPLRNQHHGLLAAGPDNGLHPPSVGACMSSPHPTYGSFADLTTGVEQYGHLHHAQPTGRFSDPNAQHESWGAAGVMFGANLNPIALKKRSIRRFGRGIKMKKGLKKTKVVQSAWCELCKIDCNSLEILNNHKLGKKHMNNLKKSDESKNGVDTISVATPATIAKEISSGGGTNSRKKVSDSHSNEDIEKKRQKLLESGSTLDSMRVCALCNVVCNSDTVFNMHLSGQNHTAKVAIALVNPEAGPDPISSFSSGTVINPNPSMSPNVNPVPPVSSIQVTAGKTKKNKKSAIKKPQHPQRCEICRIDCTGQDLFNQHIAGRKHKKNMEKLSATKKAAVAKPIHSNNKVAETKASVPSGNANRKILASAHGDNLETKKRKLVEVGTAADSIKVCTLCNVVCNSETNYNEHLAGQKHAAMAAQ